MKTQKIYNYPIEKSPLYSLTNKRKLAEILGCSNKFLENFVFTRNNYKVWHQPKNNGKGTRPVENPCDSLKKIQRRLNKLLSRIITNDYLMSGKKYTSYISNAQYHSENSCVFCFDLKSFFQKASRKYIYSAFINQFKMSPDVAWLLTDLVSIPNEDGSDGYIPTGAPTSQNIIFWAYKKTFDKIFSLTKKMNLKFSLYVDDITFSSKLSITNKLPKTIVNLFSQVGLKINIDKTEYYSKNDFKNVTGCVIGANKELLVPNRRMKEIKDIISQKEIERMNIKEIRSFYGKLNSMRQIQPGIFQGLYERAKSRFYNVGAQYTKKGRKKICKKTFT